MIEDMDFADYPRIESSLWEGACKELGISYLYVTAACPQASNLRCGFDRAEVAMVKNPTNCSWFVAKTRQFNRLPVGEPVAFSGCKSKIIPMRTC